MTNDVGRHWQQTRRAVECITSHRAQHTLPQGRATRKTRDQTKEKGRKTRLIASFYLSAIVIPRQDKLLVPLDRQQLEVLLQEDHAQHGTRVNTGNCRNYGRCGVSVHTGAMKFAWIAQEEATRNELDGGGALC